MVFGTADAGEHIVDGMDSTTGLPIISLYGSNKTNVSQLKGIDIMVLIYKMWELDFTHLLTALYNGSLCRK
jgi:uncharacterized protein YbbC (DUF1343 family)